MKRMGLRFGALLAALVALVFLAGATAFAEPAPGHITGTCFEAVHVPVLIPGLRVAAFASDTHGSWVETATTTTDATGHFDLAVPPGTYRVGVSDPDHGYRSVFASTDWRNEPATVETASDIVVDPGGSAYRDVVLDGTCALGGAVVDWAVQPLAGVTVWAERDFDHTSWSPGGHWGWSTYKETTSDASGHFAFDVAPGRYRLYVVDRAGRYLSVRTAETTVTAPQPGDYLVPMTLGAVLRGHVRDDRGSLLAGSRVAVTKRQDAGYFSSVGGGSATVAEDGSWEVAGLASGVYRVHFDGTPYTFPRYFDGATADASATLLSLATETVTDGIDATLPLGASIAGCVTEAVGGTPVYGEACLMQSQDGTWTQIAMVFSSVQDGGYEFRRLGPGTYRVKSKRGAPASAGAWVDTGVYGGGPLLAFGADIVLDAGERRTAVDFTAEVPSGLTGTVHSAQSGRPRPGVVVNVYQRQRDGEWWSLGSGATDTGGRYSFGGPWRGDCRVVVTDPSGAAYTLGYPDGDSIDTASEVQFSSGESKTLDMVLRPVVGTMTGAVHSTSGAAIPSATVDIYYKELGGWPYTEIYAKTTTAGPDGTWTATGMEPGDYKIVVTDPSGEHGHVTTGRWWTEAFHVAPASLASRDVTLPQRGVIEGTCISPDGTALAGVLVSLNNYERLTATATSDAQGHFRFERLDVQIYYGPPLDGWGIQTYWNLGAADPLRRFGSRNAFRGPLSWFRISPGETRSLVVTLPPLATRISGADRYRTAVEESRRAFPGRVRAVVIASGVSYVDALTAAPLAKAYGGPVLLTPTASLTASVTDELKRLAPTRVFVAGSTASVSAAVQTQLASLPSHPAITRFAGRDRFDTAALIGDAVRVKAGAPKKVVLVTGYDFGDALIAAPLAAAKGWPILLGHGDALSAYTSNSLLRLKPASTLIVGDASDISARVASAFPSTERVGVTDHYTNSAALVDWAEANGLALTHVAVVNGGKAWDGLSAAPCIARDGGLLLFTGVDSTPQPVLDCIASNRETMRTLDVIGSTASVSEATANGLEAALQ